MFSGGKTCDINGLVCLSRYARNITQSPTEIGCKCPQPCDLITYIPQVPKLNNWYKKYVKLHSFFLLISIYFKFKNNFLVYHCFYSNR